MGKKGGSSAGKSAAKAAKKEKQEKLASRKAAKDDKKQSKALQTSNGKNGTGKGGKGGKSGKGAKGKASAPAEEEDLDALLKKFTQDWQDAHAVNEETVGGPPSRRANATLTPCPLGNDLWLFGGEYFDGDRASFYADLYRYTPPSVMPTQNLDASTSTHAAATSQEASREQGGTWRIYSSPNQPGPRSAHQVVADPRQGGLLWLFGGEFASPKQTSFHHYRDLWVFSIANKTWERIDTKTRPSARSGHRMVLWRQYLVLFGGFIDTGARTTYLQDLWMFDTSQYKWFEIPQNDLKRPPARSGQSLLSTPEGVVLYGGYCKRYVKGQRTQGVALEDAWFLKITPQADGSLLPANTPQGGKIEWDKRRKVGYAPGPRSGCTMALWGNKNMGVLFGGVMDREDDEESMESVLYDDLFGYNLGGTGRWVSLNLRKKKKQQATGGKKKREKAAAAAAAAAAKQAEIEARIREQQEEEGEEAQDSMSSDSDDDTEAGEKQARKPLSASISSIQQESPSTSGRSTPQPVTPVQQAPIPAADDDDDPELSRPLVRFNVMLAIQRNTLYLYGGIHETSDREYTLDDFYILQLDKLERWVRLRECKIEGLEWNESDDEDDDSDDDSEDSDSDSEDEGEGENGDGQAEGVEVSALRDEEEGEEEEEEEEDLTDLLGGASIEDVDPAEIERLKAEREEIKRKAREALEGQEDTTKSTKTKSKSKSKTKDEAATNAQSSDSTTSKEPSNSNAATPSVDSQAHLSTPNPGESLREFFERTRIYWTSKAMEILQAQEAQSITRSGYGQSGGLGKELRTQGFSLASDRYEEYLPVLREIEKIQAQAGLDKEEMRQSAAKAQNGPLGGGLGVDSRHRR
ncbi:unnamed protein product [Sympodiomycopsis kandeliae]